MTGTQKKRENKKFHKFFIFPFSAIQLDGAHRRFVPRKPKFPQNYFPQYHHATPPAASWSSRMAGMPYLKYQCRVLW